VSIQSVRHQARRKFNLKTQGERTNEERANGRAVTDMVRSLLAQALPPRSHLRTRQSQRRFNWALKALRQQIRIVYELDCLRPAALPGECYRTPRDCIPSSSISKSISTAAGNPIKPSPRPWLFHMGLAVNRPCLI
jgi:hypothetical protein